MAREFTIDESGLVPVSKGRAHEYLVAKVGKVPLTALGNPNVTGWSDARLVAQGVRRLDIVTTGTVDKFSEVGLETLEAVGDRARLTLAYAYSDLATVQKLKTEDVERHSIGVLDGGTTVLGRPVYTNERALSFYWAIDTWNARNTWPAGKVAIWLMDGTRVKITEAQFETLLTDVSRHVYDTNARANSLIDQIEAWAGTVADLVALDITTGWPANPQLGP